jgi:hypothetical protein
VCGKRSVPLDEADRLLVREDKAQRSVGRVRPIDQVHPLVVAPVTSQQKARDRGHEEICKRAQVAAQIGQTIRAGQNQRIFYANRLLGTGDWWWAPSWWPESFEIAGIHGVNVNRILGLSALLIVVNLNAGEADVAGVDVTRSSDGTYRFDVTVRHGDEGWKHYANRWEVLAPDGTVLGTRTLYHLHVDEQPFTRSLSGVTVPRGVTRVTVRAHDLVHGTGGAEMVVDIPK